MIGIPGRLAVPDAYADPDPASCAAPDPDTSVMSEHADSDISRVDRAACDAPTAGLPRVVCFADRVFGPQRFDLPRQLGDVVVRRSDGLFAYQLAVSVDDMATGVTQIVRGRDLLRSTAIQLYVRRCLGSADTPEFAHLPLIDAADGRRMAKRLNSLDLGAMRERGDDPRAVVGYCAWLLRLVGEPRPMTPQELLPLFSWEAVAADTAGPRDGWWVAVPLSSRVARSGHARSVRTLTLCDRDLSFRTADLGVVTESWTPWCGGVWFVASYTWEQKVRAVERYLSCGGRALDVIRELGYPGCVGSLLRWVRAMAPGGREAVRRRPVPRGRARGVAGGVRERGDDADRGGGSGGRGPVGRGTLEAQDVARGTGAGDA